MKYPALACKQAEYLLIYGHNRAASIDSVRPQPCSKEIFGMLAFYLSLIETEEERSFFTKLYNDYRHAMFCVANKYLNDSAEAEDAVHDVFCVVADDHLKTLAERDEDGRRRFLFVCVKNRALNMLKRRAKTASLDALNEDGMEFSDEQYPLDEIVADKDMAERAKAAIKELAPEYADALYLSLQGYSSVEIAKLFQENYEAVRKRIYRAKQQLRELVLKGGAA